MSSKSSIRGATLLEVLIAVMVLSLGLLGALKLQTEGVHLNADSRYTVVASTYAHDALDAISFDRFGDSAAWKTIDSTGAAVTCSSPSSGDSRSASWQKRLACDLPSSKAKIDCATTANTCTVTIAWTPPGRSDEVTASYSMYFPVASSSSSSSSSSGG